jgi:hypothetical protein
MSKAFWQTKPLTELADHEWESLCDGCGRCCLHKLEDEDTEELLFTQVACRLLDIDTCRCTRYRKRSKLVPDCLSLRQGFKQFHWLPSTCAYRLLYEGKPLPEWHPLVSGRAESVHEAGISVRGLAISELLVDDIEDYVLEGYG